MGLARLQIADVSKQYKHIDRHLYLRVLYNPVCNFCIITLHYMHQFLLHLSSCYRLQYCSISVQKSIAKGMLIIYCVYVFILLSWCHLNLCCVYIGL